MYQLTFADKNGIKRVWASGKTLAAAINNAVAQAGDYAVSRPDTLPLRLIEATDEMFTHA